jgi:hypothetical protein
MRFPVSLSVVPVPGDSFGTRDDLLLFPSSSPIMKFTEQEKNTWLFMLPIQPDR